MYGNSSTNVSTFWPITVITQAPLWASSLFNYYSTEPLQITRHEARLNRSIARFGKKLAIIIHANIAWAKLLFMEELRRVRRLGCPLLTSLTHLVQRRGRVCGESNYYRCMLC